MIRESHVAATKRGTRLPEVAPSSRFSAAWTFQASDPLSKPRKSLYSSFHIAASDFRVSSTSKSPPSGPT